MINKVDIYVENRKLDIDDIDLAITYSFSELTNPLLVTGDYSKTITIKGTQNNNEIFGQIWRFDRTIVSVENAKNVGVFFNASKRANCKIFLNGGLFKSGYIKLNSISIDKGVYSYDVTFYSELCNVLHNMKEKKVIDLPFKNNLRHTINKSAINSFWNGNHSLSTDMTYIMANNGLYEDFNSSKMARFDGYNLVSVDIAGGLDFDECMKGEYRSYQQRPALQVKKLVDMIANENDINLDKGFFNETNPYYTSSVMTMPKLNTKEQNKEYFGVLDSSPYIVANALNYTDAWTSSQNIPYVAQEDSPIFVEESQLALGDLIGETSIVVETQVKVKFTINGSYPAGTEVLFSLSTQPTCTISLAIEDETGWVTPMTPYSDKDTKLNFLNPGKAIIEETNGVTSSGYFKFANPYSKYMGWAKTIPTMPIHFHYPASIFTSSTNYTILATITFDGAGRKCTLKQVNGMPVYDATVNSVSIELLPMNKVPVGESYDANDYYPIDGINYTNGFTGKDLTINNETSIKSNIVIDKNNIIDDEISCGDFFINYTKQFGLFYETDENYGITLKDRTSFFKNYKVLDWSDKIDYSKNIKQTPITFEKKWLELNYADTETYYNKYYNNKFGLDYGIARINTGYEFNSDTEKLNDDNIFTNAIMSKEKVNMLVGSSVKYQVDEKVLPAFFNLEDNQRNNADIKYSLLFDNGTQSLINSIVISDDPEPFDGYAALEENMWIDTNDTVMMSREGQRRSTYRQYSTITTDGTNSWKYGYPKENYAGWNKTTFPESSTIYNNFWKSYISEIYNVDNKIVKCYIKLTPNDMFQFSFRNFVKAFGCIWHVNKINNYNPLSDAPTEVEMIKVTDINGYISGQKQFYPDYVITYNSSNFTFSNTETSIKGGSSYQTTLYLPAVDSTSGSAGYSWSLKSVKVEMGGVDVTSIYYDNELQTIIIPDVSGDISITATAQQNIMPIEDELL